MAKPTYDFMLTAADEIRSNAPMMIALAKADVRGWVAKAGRS